jgi:glutamate/tyrosine decarboxylase-like PLP-dependent enzyme
MSGSIVPFTNNILDAKHECDFGVSQVSSMNVSGHKWTGIPWPCGVFVTRKKLVSVPSRDFASYSYDW